MKKIISVLAVMLCFLVLNVKAINSVYNLKKGDPTECSCCKNCKEDKCKALCKKWCSMTADEKKSEAGKKVKNECVKMCEEKKCCSADGKCEGMMESKNCCKKK
ncbi:MAG: hypothetical protein JST67_09510 [Bacteroidetes bacterium]|nr:hypothetical protein [Bacteroidota bacterium]